MKAKITFIGSGNLAWNLAGAFDLAGHQIHQVISRNEQTGQALAKTYAAFYHSSVDKLFSDSDFVFLALPDKAIRETVQQIKVKGPVVMHSAGSCDLNAISDHYQPCGVFYPLQTFTMERKPDFFKIPVFIESTDKEVLERIRELAEVISNEVVELNSEKRLFMHLAAVIVNNFNNHLLTQAEKIMDEHGLPFRYLRPLAMETVNKAFEGSPSKNQTGPAVRKDMDTLNKHLELLRSNSQLSDLYKLMSKDINPDLENRM
ncbi:MAG: DUF2520 domain-containing protein [Flavobacteriales bacterium]|nr:DUF2520 domain-containing protein [Flavobacteriales bacterium]